MRYFGGRVDSIVVDPNPSNACTLSKETAVEGSSAVWALSEFQGELGIE